nr:MAG TPA: hypothetical protein [Caudoviricetes sp.]
MEFTIFATVIRYYSIGFIFGRKLCVNIENVLD